jgi:glycosyltransferase involved in cell wall biosynthesis
MECTRLSGLSTQEALTMTTRSVKPLKVLLSAYACEPRLGSEGGIGWNIAKEMAKHYDLWVLTRANNRRAIEEETRCRPTPHLRFVYYDLPHWARFWKRGKRGVQPYYYLWQVGVYFVARKLHREVGFDLVHHVTFVKYWVPTFLALLPAPFIWGPIGGGDSAPKAFWRDFSFRGLAYEALREAARWVEEHDPFVLLAARRSSLGLATTAETAVRLRRIGVRNVRIFMHCALSEEELEQLGRYTRAGCAPIRFISIGNLFHFKGFHLGLTAFAQANLAEGEYWIVGDGPERDRLMNLARKLGIADQVQFLGRLAREEALRKLGKCNVLVHPSLHESGGWVCIEAMAAGLPVICLALGGPDALVTTQAGFKITAQTPGQVLHDLSHVMQLLAKDVGMRRRMGDAGRQLVREKFNWRCRAKELARSYWSVLETKQVRNWKK